MGEYDAIQATAASMIRRKGAAVVVTRNAVATSDPVAGTVATTTKIGRLWAVITAPSKAARFKADTLNRVVAAELTFALKDAPLLPAPGDVVTLPNGSKVRLFDVTATSPDGATNIISVGYAEAEA